MDKRQPTADLLAALKCEVLGEASLRTAYYLTLDRRRRKKVDVMRKLETQTRYRIIEYFDAKGIRVPKLYGTVIKGTLLGMLFPLARWQQILANTLAETEHYLELFYRLEQQAEAQDKALFTYIVAHEQAIQRFAELETEHPGNLASLAPMEALLDDGLQARA